MLELDTPILQVLMDCTDFQWPTDFTERQPGIKCLLMGDHITIHEVILLNKLSLNLVKPLNPNTNLLKIQ